MPSEGHEDDACTNPPTTFSETAFRLSSLALGDAAKPGKGLDIDGLCPAPPEGACLVEE